MLKRVDRPAPGSEYGAEEYAPEFRNRAQARGLDQLLVVARRQARVLALGALAGILVGLAFIASAVPQYSATTDLLIDSRKDVDATSASIADTGFDPGAIDSQVEVLKSSRIGLAVVTNLDLANNPTFMERRESFARQAIDWLRSAQGLGRWFPALVRPTTPADLKQEALARLEENLEVRRIGRTYVLEIDFTSSDPKLAASIANAFASAYLADQLDSNFEASERLGHWMQTRIAQLKTDSINSDLAVQKFKAEHGLMTADGKLVADQQLTELTAQLMAAQNDTAKAEARATQIDAMLQSGKTDGAAADVLDSGVLNDLRQKFLAASGSRPQLAADYQRQIKGELQRIRDSYRNDAQVATAKEDALKRAMTALTDERAETNQALVQLRQLEREADNYRLLYQSFLQRYQEVVQHQTAPVSEARVITNAFAPDVPSYPRRSLVMALSLVLGSLAGFGIGVLREYWDDGFRSASQVRDDLGMDFLGMLQFLDRQPRLRRARGLPNDPKRIAPRDARQRYAIDHPLSRFSETLRSVKLTADLYLSDRRTKVIGVISALPGEGKSLVSKNMASLLAQIGAPTLLVDGDLRDPGLTRSLGAHATAGILEVLDGAQPLGDVLLDEPDSGLRFLPAVVRKRLRHPGGVLSSPAMQELLAEAGKDFDYVIVDLPPVAAVVDVSAAASVFDAFILVVEWGKTSRLEVQSILASDDVLRQRCLGVVFNKVEMKQIAAYQSHGSKGYYPLTIGKYYQE